MTVRPARAAAIALIALAAALPAAASAQSGSFEGIITVQVSEAPAMQYYVRQGKLRIDAEGQGHKVSSIVDPAAHTVLVVMPEQRMYMAMSVPDSKTVADRADDMELTSTGKSEIVAGHRCEYWRVHRKGDDASKDADVCLASDLGTFMQPSGPMHRGAASAWQAALKGRDGFPLKVVQMEGGKPVTRFEVTRIEKKALDASLFEPPAGFRKMDMPAMMGGH